MSWSEPVPQPWPPLGGTWVPSAGTPRRADVCLLWTRAKEKLFALCLSQPNGQLVARVASSPPPPRLLTFVSQVHSGSVRLTDVAVRKQMSRLKAQSRRGSNLISVDPPASSPEAALGGRRTFEQKAAPKRAVIPPALAPPEHAAPYFVGEMLPAGTRSAMGRRAQGGGGAHPCRDSFIPEMRSGVRTERNDSDREARWAPYSDTDLRTSKTLYFRFGVAPQSNKDTYSAGQSAKAVGQPPMD